jgi:putative MATE family efflux protein
MENTQRENVLGTAPISKLLRTFAIPSIISMLVNSLYNIVDQIFIGQGVGYLGNAATNVVFPMTVIVMAFALLIGDGSASFLSLKLGEKDTNAAQKGVNNGFSMLIILGAAFLVIGLVFLEPLARFSGATENVLPYAKEYGGIIAIGYPFVVIGTGLNSILRADGRPRVAMISMVAGAVTNTILDPIFIFVFGWGVQGAALATIIGQALSFAISIFFVTRLKTVKINRQDMKLSGKVAKTVAGYGVSSFVTQMAITASMLVMNNALVTYGAMSPYGADIPLAALGIVMKVNSILISFVIGIAVGAQPIIGYNYGSGQLERVKKTLFTTFGIATIITAVGLSNFSSNLSNSSSNNSFDIGKESINACFSFSRISRFILFCSALSI